MHSRQSAATSGRIIFSILYSADNSYDTSTDSTDWERIQHLWLFNWLNSVILL